MLNYQLWCWWVELRVDGVEGWTEVGDGWGWRTGRVEAERGWIHPWSGRLLLAPDYINKQPTTTCSRIPIWNRVLVPPMRGEVCYKRSKMVALFTLTSWCGFSLSLVQRTTSVLAQFNAIITLSHVCSFSPLGFVSSYCDKTSRSSHTKGSSLPLPNPLPHSPFPTILSSIVHIEPPKFHHPNNPSPTSKV